MEFRLIGGVGDGNCQDGRTCPTFYATDHGTFVVQGATLSAEDSAKLKMPAHESAVEIPAELVEVIRRAERG